METVVDEKPLSLATSRIVTIEPFMCQLLSKFGGAPRRCENVGPDASGSVQANVRLNSAARWRTLQQEFNLVSSPVRRSSFLLRFLLASLFVSGSAIPI